MLHRMRMNLSLGSVVNVRMRRGAKEKFGVCSQRFD